MVSTLSVMVFYYVYNKQNQSRVLAVVVSLIFTDFMVAFLVLLWHIMQYFAGQNDHALDLMCRVFLPFPIFFFISGYGFTASKLVSQALVCHPLFVGGCSVEIFFYYNGKRLIFFILYNLKSHCIQYGVVDVPVDHDSLNHFPSWLRRVILFLVPYYWQQSLWGVWYVSLLLVLPLIALNIEGGHHLSEVVDTPISRGRLNHFTLLLLLLLLLLLSLTQ